MKTINFKFVNKQFNEISQNDSNFEVNLNHNLKVKLNKLYKKVHPDVLRGNKIFNENHVNENEKSVQELNRYFNCLKEGELFDSKTINFNCMDSLIKTNFIKYSLYLPKLTKNENTSKKKAILSNKINEILNSINQYEENAIKLQNNKSNTKVNENNSESSISDSKLKNDEKHASVTKDSIINSNSRNNEGVNNKPQYMNFEMKRQYEQSKLIAEKIIKNMPRPIKKDEYL